MLPPVARTTDRSARPEGNEDGKRSGAGVWLIFRREFATTRRNVDAEKCA